MINLTVWKRPNIRVAQQSGHANRVEHYADHRQNVKLGVLIQAFGDSAEMEKDWPVLRFTMIPIRVRA